jgi:hypothetical protein
MNSLTDMFVHIANAIFHLQLLTLVNTGLLVWLLVRSYRRRGPKGYPRR